VNHYARLLVAALGTLLLASGCAVVADGGTEGRGPGIAQAGGSSWTKAEGSRPDSPFLGGTSATRGRDPAVAPAVAFDEPGRDGLVRQTGGVLSESAKAIEDGAGKVGQALRPPPPPVVPADDPTSVFTKAKPSPELYIAMARYYEQAGQVSQADQAYQRGLKLAPKHLSVLLNYARFKDRLGRRQEAMDLYQKALKLYPKEPSLYNDLGLFFARQGNSREAIEYYQRAIQLQPTRPLYRHNLAIVLVDSGQAEKAMEHLTATGGEAEACYKMGYLLQKKGQLPEAAAYFERATRIDPSMQEAKLWLAHVRGQLDAGQRVARRPEPPSGAPQPTRRESPAGSPAPWPADPRPPAGRPVTPPPRPATEGATPRVGPRAAPSDGASPGGQKGPAAPQRLPLPSAWEEKRMYDDPSADEPPLPPPTNSGAAPVGAKGAVGEALDNFPPLPDDVLGGPGAPEPSSAGSRGARPSRLPPPEPSKAGPEGNPKPAGPPQKPPLPSKS